MRQNYLNIIYRYIALIQYVQSKIYLNACYYI